MDFFWLDIQVKEFGFEITVPQQRLLNRSGYAKSFLLLEPAEMTHTDLEYMFTIPKIIIDIANISKKSKQYFVDFIKKSNCIMLFRIYIVLKMQ